jgi:hypothetical protein
LPSYRSSDEEELNEINRRSTPKDDLIKEGEGYSGSNSSDESDGASNGIAIPGARLRLLQKEHSFIYRKTLRLSSDQIVSIFITQILLILKEFINFGDLTCKIFIPGKLAAERRC